ncbi:hypothetical protein EX30DRAFT_366625 [Ascodesmis nigricans]|uniref:Helicase ATP-binding domain-containing protein n=1 Tax=Ascodesmis nigricans TaxID=341454 RepID=A0A4S2MKG4_9PEZI|nr:hypothetical protein EX30DRAFT_366625 [Ascodesmis nigricans]
MARISPEILAHYTLFNDLSTFTGIGTLRFYMPRRAAPGPDAPDGWHWLEDDPWPAEYTPSDIPRRVRELLVKGLVRLTYRMVSGTEARVRVYILPEDVRGELVLAKTGAGKGNLRKVLLAVDTSREAWEGDIVVRNRRSLFEVEKEEDESCSLFYLFNTIPSPAPDPESPWIGEERVRERMRSVLGVTPFPECGEDGFRGLKTMPYSYQKESIAMMVQREMAPEKRMDPRLKEMVAPTGEVYYIDTDSLRIYESPVYYDDVRGGILAEEMGTGKTLMCLGLITATKGEYSTPPRGFTAVIPAPETPAHPPSLLHLSLTTIRAHNVWIPDSLPTHHTTLLHTHTPFYLSPTTLRTRSRRQSLLPPPTERIHLSACTIIVCPQNLVRQWLSEISKHVLPGFLSVCVLDQTTSVVPSIPELLKYDILLFSRNRFDREVREGSDAQGRRVPYGVARACECPYIGATRTPDCTCFKVEEVYNSPLFRVRWKRIVIDEGHFLGAGGKSRGVEVAGKLNAERRWIVTGTPGDNLMGVMAGMVAVERESVEEKRERERQALEARRLARESEERDLERIGNMVRDYLKLEPWTVGCKNQASWKTTITAPFLLPTSAATHRLRTLFSHLLLRHLPASLESSHPLPFLHSTITPLPPNPLEKLTLNLFTMSLTINAITSERQDEDYMFHPRNASALRLLTTNLREAAFYWAGTSRTDVAETVGIARAYMRKNGRQLGSEDRAAMEKAIEVGEMALGCHLWNWVAEFHEMGWMVEGLPEEVAEAWEVRRKRLGRRPVVGATLLLEMQRFVRERMGAWLSEEEMWEELKERGREVVKRYKEWVGGEKERVDRRLGRGEERRGIARGTVMEPTVGAGAPLELAKKEKGKKTAKPKSPATSKSNPKSPSSLKSSSTPKPRKTKKPDSTTPAPTSILRPPAPAPAPILPRAHLLPPLSTKLHHLLCSLLNTPHKTLIFTTTPTLHSHLLHSLSLLAIPTLSIPASQPAPTTALYLHAFHTLERYKVLLMDLQSAGRGLNVCCARRVVFVGVVEEGARWAQAVKRVWRMGVAGEVRVDAVVVGEVEGGIAAGMGGEGMAVPGEAVKKESGESIDATKNNVPGPGVSSVSDSTTRTRTATAETSAPTSQDTATRIRDIIRNLHFYELTEEELGKWCWDPVGSVPPVGSSSTSSISSILSSTHSSTNPPQPPGTTPRNGVALGNEPATFRIPLFTEFTHGQAWIDDKALQREIDEIESGTRHDEAAAAAVATTLSTPSMPSTPPTPSTPATPGAAVARAKDEDIDMDFDPASLNQAAQEEQQSNSNGHGETRRRSIFGGQGGIRSPEMRKRSRSEEDDDGKGDGEEENGVGGGKKKRLKPREKMVRFAPLPVGMGGV